jgi:hypothetical protein
VPRPVVGIVSLRRILLAGALVSDEVSLLTYGLEFSRQIVRWRLVICGSSVLKGYHARYSGVGDGDIGKDRPGIWLVQKED